MLKWSDWTTKNEEKFLQDEWIEESGRFGQWQGDRDGWIWGTDSGQTALQQRYQM